MGRLVLWILSRGHVAAHVGYVGAHVEAGKGHEREWLE